MTLRIMKFNGICNRKVHFQYDDDDDDDVFK